MTGLFHELRCNSGRQGVVTPPYGGKERGRAGRCRHRPALLCIIVGAVGLVFPSPLHFSSFCGILGIIHLILKEFSPWKP